MSTTVAPRDPLERWRRRIGRDATLRVEDRRPWMAGEDRELVAYASDNPRERTLTKGERKARGDFLALVQAGVDLVSAIARALGIADGPILECQTRQEFDGYWTRDRLADVAARWRLSRLTRPYVPSVVHEAIRDVKSEAKASVATLVEIRDDPKAPKLTRARCAGSLLKHAIDVALKEMPERHAMITGRETPAELEAMLLRVHLLEEDVNRARLLTENIKSLLKVHDPERWGEKLDLRIKGPLDVAGAWENFQTRKNAAIAARLQSPAMSTAKAVPDDTATSAPKPGTEPAQPPDVPGNPAGLEPGKEKS